MEDNASASNEDSNSAFGSHEEFDPFLTLQYKIKELEHELKTKDLFEKHLLWHCLIYREALKKLPNGCKSLRDTLHDFKLNESKFLNKCACCEHENYKKTLQKLQEKTKQILDGESKLNDKEKRCSSCCIDSLWVQIHDQLVLLQNDSGDSG